MQIRLLTLLQDLVKTWLTLEFGVVLIYPDSVKQQIMVVLFAIGISLYVCFIDLM